MNNNLTELVCILDMSGSMMHLTDDTIGGYNSFIAEQKKQPGEAVLTTILFDDRYILLYDHVDIKNTGELTTDDYRPCGCTALMDAVGKTIVSVGQRLADTPEEERPGKVIFMITTDGYENASKEYTRAKVREMIMHQKEKYSWEFIFIGAGIDAYAEARSIGIDGLSAMSVSASSFGTKTAYCSITSAVNTIRSGTALDDRWKNGQTESSAVL